MSAPGSDWVHLNQPAAFFSDEKITDATIVATATPPSDPNSGGYFNPEGKASKPIRRRSRASRRTPTTLLNTDTVNFRAMVQQFTGGSCGPLSMNQPGSSAGFTYNYGGFVPPLANHRVLYQLQLQQQQHQYLLSLNNKKSSEGDGFFQRVGNDPPAGSNNGFMF